jgi:hypothetical protein
MQKAVAARVRRALRLGGGCVKLFVLEEYTPSEGWRPSLHVMKYEMDAQTLLTQFRQLHPMKQFRIIEYWRRDA